MNKSLFAFHKETVGLVFRGIKNNFVVYFLGLTASIAAIATVILAPMGIKYLIGMHEMLIVDGKIDYRKLLTQVEEDKNYFKTLIVLLVELAIIAGGTVLFVVPGVIMALALVPANLLLYRGMAPKPSQVIPASFDAMKGKKTNLFLILLVYALPLGIVVGALLFVTVLVNLIFVTVPIMIIIAALSLYSALHLLALLISFARQALEKPAEQPQTTIAA